MNTIAGVSLFTLFLVVKLSIISVNCQSQQLQYVNFYNDSGCTGDIIWQHNGTQESSVMPVQLPTQVLYYRVNGLWTVQPCSQRTCTTSTFVSGSGSNCLTQIIATGINRLIVNRFGDPYQEAKEIHLFSDRYFNGVETTVNETGISGENITVRSYYFTGANSWQINNETCLNYTKELMTYNFTSYNLQITKITYGCNLTTPIITTTIPTGSTETAPTTTLKPCNETANQCNKNHGFQFNVNGALYVLVAISMFAY